MSVVVTFRLEHTGNFKIVARTVQMNTGVSERKAS
jgi:hypothetical protein